MKEGNKIKTQGKKRGKKERKIRKTKWEECKNAWKKISKTFVLPERTDERKNIVNKQRNKGMRK